MGIEDILMFDETLFRDTTIFDLDYVPETYNFRDTQMEAMAYEIRPALRGSMPGHSVILGTCGTGKTTAVKKVFEMVEKTSESVVCCYINCQINHTKFSILSQIHKKVFGHKPPETGVPFLRIYTKIMEKLVKNEQTLIVALDDANFIFENKQGNEIFYYLLRAHEEIPNAKAGLFVVIPDFEFRYALDKTVKTVFIPQEIVFEPYSYDEINSILKDRAKIGFYPNVISDEIIEKISDYTYENGDLRVGIDLLKSCGNIAESDASRKITEEHLEKALKKHVSSSIKEAMKILNDSEKELLDEIIEESKKIKSNEVITSTRVFTKLTKNKKNSYSKLKRTLERLEFLRLIDTSLTGKGVRGKTTQIYLRFNPEDLE